MISNKDFKQRFQTKISNKHIVLVFQQRVNLLMRRGPYVFLFTHNNYPQTRL